MAVEAKVSQINGQFLVDIVETCGIVKVEDLPELLYTLPKTYSRESAAEKAGDAAAKSYTRSSVKSQRRLCGYDPESQCCHPRVLEGFRARNRNVPVRQPKVEPCG